MTTHIPSTLLEASVALPEPAEWALQLAAQAWRHPSCSDIKMDGRLGNVFARMLTSLAESFERQHVAVPGGYWLAPMEPDDAMRASLNTGPGRWVYSNVETYQRMRDSWLARHPAPPAREHEANVRAELARSARAVPDTTRELLETFTTWARQVAAREDVPRGIRSAAANLHADGKRHLALRAVTPQVADEGREQAAITDDEIQAIHLGLRGEARNVITFARAVLAKVAGHRDAYEGARENLSEGIYDVAELAHLFIAEDDAVESNIGTLMSRGRRLADAVLAAAATPPPPIITLGCGQVATTPPLMAAVPAQTMRDELRELGYSDTAIKAMGDSTTMMQRAIDSCAGVPAQTTGVHDFASQPSVEESLANLVAEQQSRAVPAQTGEVARLVENCKREARHLFDLAPDAEDMAHLSMAIDRLAALAHSPTVASPKCPDCYGGGKVRDADDRGRWVMLTCALCSGTGTRGAANPAPQLDGGFHDGYADGFDAGKLAASPALVAEVGGLQSTLAAMLALPQLEPEIHAMDRGMGLETFTGKTILAARAAIASTAAPAAKVDESADLHGRSVDESAETHGEVVDAEFPGTPTIAECIVQLDMWNGHLEAAIDRQALEKLGQHPNDEPAAGGRDPMEQFP